jgi:Zn-dependent metalloprotease
MKTRSFLSVARLSLIGVAILLTHCGQDVTDPSAPAPGQETHDVVARPESGVDKRLDLRGTLDPVGSDSAVPRGSDLSADARAYAVSVVSRAGVLSPAFEELRTMSDVDGLTHVRLRQLHQGLKVWGADVVVHASEHELLSMAGTVAPGLGQLDTTTSLEPAQVLALARTDRFGSRVVPTSREEVEKVIFVDSSSTPHVAFHSSLYNELEGSVAPGLWNHIVDAKTGEVLARWNAIDTLSQASGPGGNAKYFHPWQSELDVEAKGTAFVMTTTRLRTLNLRNAQSGGVEVTGSLAAIGDAAINDAHGYAEVTLNMMSDWMGQSSINGNGMRILSRVHYGVRYENAFWDGTQMTYGDGANTFYPLSGALDVVAHEINHGFTQFHSGLAYSNEAGGLNESFSDIAGKTAEFYYKTNPTWDLGADIFKSNGALRYMCNPTADGRSIDHASKMTPSLDPHFSSGPPNKAFCRASKRASTNGDANGTANPVGVHRIASAFYLANAQYWTSSSTYVQACKGTIDAAKALGFSATELDYLRTSWADVGIFCDGAAPPPPPCDQILTGATGTLTSPNYPSNYGDRFSKVWCVDAAPGKTVTLSFQDFATESGYDFVTVSDKAGTVLSKKSGTSAPPAATSSRIYVKFTSDEYVTARGWKASWTTN